MNNFKGLLYIYIALFFRHKTLENLIKPAERYILYEIYNTEKSKWTVAFILQCISYFEALTETYML
jgi:hypothetical protein